MNLSGKKGFGVNEVVAIAAGLVIAVLVVIPGIRTFAGNVIQSLGAWWQGIADNLFTMS